MSLPVVTLYGKLCKQYNVERQKRVEISLELCRNGILDLNGETLSVGTCAVLGKIFESSNYITKVSFDDCLLEEECMRPLLLGLCANRSIKTAIFKGNKIQSSSGEALAKMLKHNEGIIRLSLEWSCLGSCTNFTAFCEALSINKALEYLDLRSNEIAADAAVNLARALALNSTLSSVDLRWNNIGTRGGQAILECIQNSRNLMRVDVTGCNIPKKVMEAICLQQAQNVHSESLKREYRSRADHLKEKLKFSEIESSLRIAKLEQSLTSADEGLDKTLKQSSFKLGQLEEELTTKQQEVEALESKLLVVVSAHSLCKERVEFLERELSKREDDLQVALKGSAREKQQQEEHLHRIQEEASKEKSALQETILKLELQVSELQHRCKRQNQEIINLKETLCSLQMQLNSTRGEMDAVSASEKQQHKEALKAMDEQHSQEISQLKHTQDERLAEIHEKLHASNLRSSEVEQSLASLKTQVVSERNSAQAQLATQKHQLRVQHTAELQDLKDRLKETEKCRDETEERLQLQISTHSSLSKTNAKLSARVHSLESRLTELQAELDTKSSELHMAESRVREEHRQVIEELKKEKAKQTEELREEKEELRNVEKSIKHLKKTILEKEEVYEAALLRKTKETEDAVQKMKQAEMELSRYRNEELQRNEKLRSAFVSYFQSSPRFGSS